ncbi:hypothetical protein AGLY_002880 [Aphis glycines]|uniref:Uncharacterized protein n=1 Tax=Aphis glycines TaxID=307491 RepID=A0A6G0U2W9_APHGL|nr:hypothetical protein AGLY_002880 [Aphis glycines]
MKHEIAFSSTQKISKIKHNGIFMSSSLSFRSLWQSLYKVVTKLLMLNILNMNVRLTNVKNRIIYLMFIGFRFSMNFGPSLSTNVKYSVKIMHIDLGELTNNHESTVLSNMCFIHDFVNQFSLLLFSMLNLSYLLFLLVENTPYGIHETNFLTEQYSFNGFVNISTALKHRQLVSELLCNLSFVYYYIVYLHFNLNKSHTFIKSLQIDLVKACLNIEFLFNMSFMMICVVKIIFN